MGIIFIKDIQSRLDKTISYIGNKKKTLNENYEEIFLDLHNALDYTVDDLKTEQKFYVDGINCRYENTLNKMTETKKEWHKTDKILGYHIIQSFAPGEGTPESIHELGKEFARRAFGDRFEVVVATHLNTNCIHNHFVLNSVSFMDGKKYYDNNESYATVMSSYISVVMSNQHTNMYLNFLGKKPLTQTPTDNQEVETVVIQPIIR